MRTDSNEVGGVTETHLPRPRFTGVRIGNRRAFRCRKFVIQLIANLIAQIGIQRIDRLKHRQQGCLEVVYGYRILDAVCNP